MQNDGAPGRELHRAKVLKRALHHIKVLKGATPLEVTSKGGDAFFYVADNNRQEFPFR